jgi:hypothetical protein
LDWDSNHKNHKTLPADTLLGLQAKLTYFYWASRKEGRGKKGEGEERGEERSRREKSNTRVRFVGMTHQSVGVKKEWKKREQKWRREGDRRRKRRGEERKVKPAKCLSVRFSSAC